jgi:DNA-binding MarR family transcriptional regulator
MSPQNKPTGSFPELIHELRQCYGLGASFFRALAARNEMTDTEIQVIDLLESGGDATAGQLASLMGLTTGTFTAILNRLEKAGLVRRERDPNDGRRVIVRLVKDADDGQRVSPLFASLEKAWAEMAAQYDDKQRALLLDFLQRSNGLAREEIVRLREVSVGDEGSFSAPLADLESARLVVHAEYVQLNLRTGALGSALYRARFEGPVPDVKLKDGVLTIRYPRRLWLPGMEKRIAEITLTTAIPWQITLKGGGAEMTAALGHMDLLEMEANGAGSIFSIELPDPSRRVPIRLIGSGSEFSVRRPSGVAAQVQTKGWGTGVVFDSQTISGPNRLQSPGYEDAAARYDIETSGSGSMMTIASG